MKKKITVLLFLMLKLITTSSLLAYDPFLLQKNDHLKFKIKCINTNEDLYKLSQNYIVILDYDLLKNDFPELQRMSNDQIQEIILDDIGYIAKTQGDKGTINRTNDQISFDNKSIKIGAIRQFDFGRALDVPFFNGYINIKGIGAQDPIREEHKDGLMTLGEALREYTYSQIINMVLTHAHVNHGVVRSYGVIYPGFNVTWKNGTSDPAGFLLRRAYNRQESYSVKNKDIEELLSDYNIIMGNNIQNTEKGDIIDLGHIIMGHIEDKDDNEKAPNILENNIGNFNELYGHDSRIKISERWGYSKNDYMWNRMHDLAREFYENKNQKIIYNAVEEYLRPIKDILFPESINNLTSLHINRRSLSCPDLNNQNKLCGHLGQIFNSRKLKLNSKILSGHTQWITSAIFSPDGSKVITVSIDKTAIIWDVASSKQLSTFPIEMYRIDLSDNTSPDGSKVVILNNNTAVVYNVKNKEKISTLIGHTDWINSVAFSPDGNKVVTASNDKTAIIWDVMSGEKLCVLTGHMAWVNSATFSPDGNKVITASNDKTAIIWDVTSCSEHQNVL